MNFSMFTFKTKNSSGQVDVDNVFLDREKIKSVLAKHKKTTLAEMLMNHIDFSGEKDSTVYRRAQIDRRVFSKIRSDKNYHPRRDTVLALSLSLCLNRHDTDELLESAGYALSRSVTRDLAIAFCIEREIFDIDNVNIILNHLNETPLMNR